MLQPKDILGFALRFIGLCALLIFPWPGWKQFYGQYFRTVSGVVFPHRLDNRRLLFETYAEVHGFSSLDAKIVLSNVAMTDQQGHCPAKVLNIDTRSLAWMPTALTMALILSTPLIWPRRVWALILGLLLIHGFLFMTVQCWIWDQSSELSLLTVSPFWQSFLDNLEYTLVDQIGVSFSVPLLIWIIVCFRSVDLSRLAPSPAKNLPRTVLGQ